MKKNHLQPASGFAHWASVPSQRMLPKSTSKTLISKPVLPLGSTQESSLIT